MSVLVLPSTRTDVSRVCKQSLAAVFTALLASGTFTMRKPKRPKPRDPKIQLPRDPETQRPKYSKTQRPRDPEIQLPRPRDPETQILKDPETQRPRDPVTQTQRPRDPETQILEDPETQRPRDPVTQRPRDPFISFEFRTFCGTLCASWQRCLHTMHACRPRRHTPQSYLVLQMKHMLEYIVSLFYACAADSGVAPASLEECAIEKDKGSCFRNVFQKDITGDSHLIPRSTCPILYPVPALAAHSPKH
jgi:hypothetical protein